VWVSRSRGRVQHRVPGNDRRRPAELADVRRRTVFQLCRSSVFGRFPLESIVVKGGHP
jgi:hypothetical protein